MNPATLVQQQLAAYNARNIDDFCATFSQDIVLYNFGAPEPYLSGIAQLRSEYQKVFDNSPQLNCRLVNEMVLGNTVIYHEKATGRMNTTVEVIAIYEVADSLITKLTFIRN